MRNNHMDDNATGGRLSVPTNPARALRDLNRQAPPPSAKAAEDDADETTNNTTILQSDKPTDQQTNLQTDQQTVKQADPPTDRPTNRPTNQPSKKPSDKRAGLAEAPPAEPPRKPRIDGRTLRARQETADRTMVTSLRLAVSTVDALDEYCWRHRQRKQDVVQAALDMYFAAPEGEEA